MSESQEKNAAAMCSVHRTLQVVRERWISVKRQRGMWWALGLSILWLALMLSIDAWWFFESTTLRGLLSGLFFGGVMGVWYWWWWRPAAAPPSDLTLARWLEIRHPEFQERPSTVLELQAADAMSASNTLNTWQSKLVDQAAHDLATITPTSEISSAPTKPARLFALVALGAVFLMIAWQPHWWGLHTQRLLMPWREIFSPLDASLRLVTGDLTVTDEEAVELVIAAHQTAGKTASIDYLELLIQADNESTVRSEKLRPSTHPAVSAPSTAFVYRRAPSAKSFRYAARKGRARTPWATVTVTPCPQIKNLRATITFPAYTKRAAQTDDPTHGDLRAVAGSRVELEASLTHPAHRGQVRYDQTEQHGPPVVIKNDPHPTASWAADFSPGLNIRWSFLVEGAGQSLSAPREGLLRTIEDLAPALSIDSPTERALTLSPEDQLPVMYAVADDFGLASVEFRYRIDDQPEQKITLPLPAADPSAALTWRDTAWFSLRTLSLAQARRIELRLAAADNLPASLQGPQWTISEPIFITLQKGASSYAQQIIESQREQMQSKLEALKHDLYQLRAQTDQNLWQLKRENDLSAEMLQWLEKLTQQTAAAAEQLTATAAVMRDSIFAQRAPFLQKAADEFLRPAQENFARIPTQDRGAERHATAEQARFQIDQSLRALEDLSGNLWSDQLQAQEVVQLQALADQEQALAENAQKIDLPDLEAAARLTPDQLQDALKLPDEWLSQQQHIKNQAEHLQRQANQQESLGQPEALRQAAKALEAAATETARLAQSYQTQLPPAQPHESLQARAEETQRQQHALREIYQQHLQTLSQNPLAADLSRRTLTTYQHTYEKINTETNSLKQTSQEQNRARKRAEQKADDARQRAAEHDQPVPDRASQMAADPAWQAAQKQFAEALQQAQTQQQKAHEELTTAADSLRQASHSLRAQADERDALLKTLAQAAQHTSTAAEKGETARQQTHTTSQKAAEAAYQAQQDGERARALTAAMTADQALHTEASPAATAAAENLRQAANHAHRHAEFSTASLTTQTLRKKSQPQPGSPMSTDSSLADQNASADADSQSSSNRPSAAQTAGQTPSSTTAATMTPDGELPAALAALGLTPDDWTRLRSSLSGNSSLSALDTSAIPADYRPLVQQYFRALADPAVARPASEK